MKIEGRVRVTKLKARSDAENKKSDAEIKELNEKIFKHYSDNNFISGYYAVEEGMSFTGTLFFEVKVGQSLVLQGRDPLQTTTIQEIIQETEKKYLIKTRNSVYLLERL